jgi:hypothetical protein
LGTPVRDGHAPVPRTDESDDVVELLGRITVHHSQTEGRLGSDPPSGPFLPCRPEALHDLDSGAVSDLEWLDIPSPIAPYRTQSHGQNRRYPPQEGPVP